jgi:hypothetical protein
MTKVKVKAIQPFSHGNVTAAIDGTYEFNKGDAERLRDAGFVTMDAAGDAEQTQVDQPKQVAQPGDVVVDNGPEMLGAKQKMADAPENKMADAPANKSRQKKAD